MLSLSGSTAGTGQQAAGVQPQLGLTCSRRFTVRASPLVAAFKSSAEEDIAGAGAACCSVLCCYSRSGACMRLAAC